MIDVQRATAGMPARLAHGIAPGIGLPNGLDAGAAAGPDHQSSGRSTSQPSGVVEQDVAAVGRGQRPTS